MRPFTHVTLVLLIGLAAPLSVRPSTASGALAAAPAATNDAPAPRRADTPKEALRLLNEAMRTGDPAQIRSVMFATTPAQVRMVDAMSDMAAAMAELNRAAVKAFGSDGARDVTGDADADSEAGIARINAAEVTLDGDRATVVYIDKKKDPETGKDVEERSPPVTLIRAAGTSWKVPVSQLATGLAADALERRLLELDVQTKLIREVATEVTAGRYQSPEQAAEAWHSKLMHSLTPRPATRKDAKPPTQGAAATE